MVALLKKGGLLSSFAHEMTSLSGDLGMDSEQNLGEAPSIHIVDVAGLAASRDKGACHADKTFLLVSIPGLMNKYEL